MINRPVCRSVTDHVGPGITPCQPSRQLRRGGLAPDGLAEHGIRVRLQRHLDAQHEAHRLQPAKQRGASAGLEGDPGPFAVINEVQIVFDMALGGEHERLHRGLRGERGQLLRRERVKPGEAVRARHRQDVTMAEIHCGKALDEQPLLAHRIAIMGGDPVIGALTRDCCGPIEQRGPVSRALFPCRYRHAASVAP